MSFFSFKRKEMEKINNLSIGFFGAPEVGKSTFLHSSKKLNDRTYKMSKTYKATSTKEELILFYDDFMFSLIDLPGHNNIKNIQRTKKFFSQKSDAFVVMICNITSIEEDIMKEVNKIKSYCGDSCDKPIFIIFNKKDLFKGQEKLIMSVIEGLNLNRRYNGNIVYGLISLWENKYYGEDHTKKTRGYIEARNPIIYVYEYIINEINKDWVYSNSPIYLKK